MDPVENTKQEVKSADALGRLSSRTQTSRTISVLIAVIGFIVLAFLVGMIWRGITGGINNAPDIPQVEL